MDDGVLNLDVEDVVVDDWLFAERASPTEIPAISHPATTAGADRHAHVRIGILLVKVLKTA